MAETSWKTRARIFLRAQRKRTVWYRLLSAMAMVVVFITTYLLILPAITMESKAECGKPEHQHGAACYSTSYEPGKLFLVCTREALGIHEHTEACYDESGALICRAGDSISVGEAVHVLERICADASNNEVFVSAAVDLRQQEQSLTRADAAVMLCRVLDFQKDGETIGLFGWTTAA